MTVGGQRAAPMALSAPKSKPVETWARFVPLGRSRKILSQPLSPHRPCASWRLSHGGNGRCGGFSARADRAGWWWGLWAGRGERSEPPHRESPRAQMYRPSVARGRGLGAGRSRRKTRGATKTKKNDSRADKSQLQPRRASERRSVARARLGARPRAPSRTDSAGPTGAKKRKEKIKNLYCST